MTEAEWLASSTPDDMIFATVPRHVSFRKLRLFLAGCCRRRWSLFADSKLASLVELIEQFADGQRDQSYFDVAVGEVWKEYRLAANTGDSSNARSGQITFALEIACYRDDTLLIYYVFAARVCSAGLVPDLLAEAYAGSQDAQANPADAQVIIASETTACADLFRCIAGNPFRPTLLQVGWRTETVVGLASGIYEDRAFDRLPILADALEEAGCDQPAILAHCREPRVHARGCWVVDAVLGKQ